MHALVIGAGPAGSVAALLLARRGVAVTLVEQSRFPRDKVCGECVSALGRSVLQRHDLEEPLMAAGGVELTSTCLRAGGQSASLALPSPMLGISRAVLDSSLLAAAAAAGVTVLQPARAESIEGGGDVARCVVRDLRTNDVRTLTADAVFLADGRSALLGDRPAATGDLGIKAHFEHVDVPASAITLFGGGGCYGGVAPIEGGRWNVAISLTAARVKAAGGDLTRCFELMLSGDPAMAAAFANSRRLGDWLAAPLPRFAVRDDWPARVVPVGNAAAALEPIGGEGMGLAMASAELAVDALLSGRVDRLPMLYRVLWNRRSRFCRLAARLMAAPSTAAASIELLDRSSLATLPLMKLIGK